jgi:hypothetical protein
VHYRGAHVGQTDEHALERRLQDAARKGEQQVVKDRIGQSDEEKPVDEHPRLGGNPQLGGARGEAHRRHQRSHAVVGPAQPGHDAGADEGPAGERPENGDELR